MTVATPRKLLTCRCRSSYAAAAGELPPLPLFDDVPELDDSDEDDVEEEEEEEDDAEDESEDDELSLEPPLELPLVLEPDDDRLSVR